MTGPVRRLSTNGSHPFSRRRFLSTSAAVAGCFGASALLGAQVGHPVLFPASRGFYPNFPPEVPQQLYDNADGINRFTGSATLNNATGLDFVTGPGCKLCQCGEFHFGEPLVFAR